MNKKNNILVITGIFLVTMLAALSLSAQITRTQIMNNANTYASFTWTATSGNIRNNVYCSSIGKYIQTPSWVTIGNKTAVPYCWGGWSTTSSFATGISNAKSAGDNNTATSYGDQYGNCAVGVDCSGFAERAWGISSAKYNCTMLGNVSSQISASQVQAGDILNRSDHVRLVQSYNPSNGYTTVLESSARDWKVSSYTYSPLQNSSYTPRVYNNVVQCSTPTNIYSANITSNSAKIYCDGVNSATQYSIGVKTSNNSTYTYYTISTLPIYLTSLLSGTTYNYKIAAYCSSFGWTVYSSVYSFTTSSGSSCPQPYGIYLSSLSGTSATLNWTSPSAISYNYFLKPSYQSTYWVYSNYNYKPITFSGLRPSTTYNIIVSSNCSGTTSLQSSVYTFSTPAYRLSSDGTSSGGKKQNSSEGSYMLSVPDETSYQNNILMFPNPISAGQELSIEGISVNSKISIYNSEGRLIGSLKQINGSQFKFSLPNKLPASIYMIQIGTQNGNTIFKKLIVK